MEMDRRPFPCTKQFKDRFSGGTSKRRTVRVHVERAIESFGFGLVVNADKTGHVLFRILEKIINTFHET